LSDQVVKKIVWEDLLTFFNVTSKASSSLSSEVLSLGEDNLEKASSKLGEAISQYQHRFIATLIDPSEGFEKSFTQFKALSFHPKTPEAFLIRKREGSIADSSSLQEYCGIKKEGEDHFFLTGLKCCLGKTITPLPISPSKDEIAAARENFINNLALNIVDPVGKEHFISLMEGLLANESEETKWIDAYENHFAWSEEDLACVDQYTFTNEDILAQNVAGDGQVADMLSSDPKLAGYVAGLILHAEDIDGNQDPEFVTEYQEYLELTLSQLASEDKLTPSAIKEHLKTPEIYRKQGFLNLPERSGNALSGSAFMKDVLGVDLEEFKKNPRQLGKLSKVEKENAILEQIELGNVPDFLRRPKAVIIKGPDGEEVKTYVMPDYIAIGSNEDFVRVPLSPIIAQAFARKYGLALPTKTIVEETYLQADNRVVGPSYSHAEEFAQNSAYLDSAGFYLRSNEDINAQLKDVAPGALVSGGKKELVVSPFVAVRAKGVKVDESIGFYGLFDTEGVPIQRSPGHGGEMGYRHTEYALGIRFVSPMIVVQDASGKKKVMTMNAALQDPKVAKIISRLERTDKLPDFRSTLMDGPFDPNTCYQQKIPKGNREPRGPNAR